MPNQYDPKLHHRRSIRLPGYNYSQSGWYYVTICTQNHLCLFGDITGDQIRLNNAGLMVEKRWNDLNEKFPSVETDLHVVMPNHFHGIIHLGQPHGIAPTLGRIINWFKTMTTNRYINGVKQSCWPPFPGKLWQRNYYEHIIRNEEDLSHIRQYISENPAHWSRDKENRKGDPK